MEADYQEFPYGGNGYLRILRFAPADDRIYATTYSPFDGTSITTSPDQMDMAYAMAGPGTFSVIGTVNGVASGANASISWSGLENNTSYEWYAEASDGALSTTSSTWNFTTALAAPEGINATDGAFTHRVVISWNAVPGATFYEVYRNTSNASSGSSLLGFPTLPPFSDASAAPGTTYWYSVKACNSAGCSAFSSSDSGYPLLVLRKIYLPLVRL